MGGHHESCRFEGLRPLACEGLPLAGTATAARPTSTGSGGGTWGDGLDNCVQASSGLSGTTYAAALATPCRRGRSHRQATTGPTSPATTKDTHGTVPTRRAATAAPKEAAEALEGAGAREAASPGDAASPACPSPTTEAARYTPWPPPHPHSQVHTHGKRPIQSKVLDLMG